MVSSCWSRPSYTQFWTRLVSLLWILRSIDSRTLYEYGSNEYSQVISRSLLEQSDGHPNRKGFHQTDHTDLYTVKRDRDSAWNQVRYTDEGSHPAHHHHLKVTAAASHHPQEAEVKGSVLDRDPIVQRDQHNKPHFYRAESKRPDKNKNSEEDEDEIEDEIQKAYGQLNAAEGKSQEKEKKVEIEKPHPVLQHQQQQQQQQHRVEDNIADEGKRLEQELLEMEKNEESGAEPIDAKDFKEVDEKEVEKALRLLEEGVDTSVADEYVDEKETEEEIEKEIQEMQLEEAEVSSEVAAAEEEEARKMSAILERVSEETTSLPKPIPLNQVKQMYSDVDDMLDKLKHKQQKKVPTVEVTVKEKGSNRPVEVSSWVGHLEHLSNVSSSAASHSGKKGSSGSKHGVRVHMRASQGSGVNPEADGRKRAGGLGMGGGDIRLGMPESSGVVEADGGDVAKMWDINISTIDNNMVDERGNLKNTGLSSELDEDIMIHEGTAVPEEELEDEEGEDNDKVKRKSTLSLRRAAAHKRSLDAMRVRLEKERAKAIKEGGWEGGIPVQYGSWTRLALGGDQHEWRFLSSNCTTHDQCLEPEADLNLQRELSLDSGTSVESLLQAMSDPLRWYANTDKAQRIVMCRGASRQARHDRPWWCQQGSSILAQAAPGGRLSDEVDEAEKAWRVAAIARQRAKFAQLSLAKAHRHEQRLLRQKMEPVLAAFQALQEKKKKLQQQDKELTESQLAVDSKLRNWMSNYEDEERFFEDIEIEEWRSHEKLGEVRRRVELERKNEDVLGAFMDERTREKQLRKVERAEEHGSMIRLEQDLKKARLAKAKEMEEELQKEKERQKEEQENKLLEDMSPEEREKYFFDHSSVKARERQAREEERFERERFHDARERQRDQSRQLALHKAMKKEESRMLHQTPRSKFINIKHEFGE